MIASALWSSGHLFGPDVVVTDPEDLSPKHDLLILHGGEDISPSLYGEKVNKSYADPYPSNRDKKEWALVDRAIKLGIPIFGICRGAQLLCAFAGGKLYQHVYNHSSWHPLLYKGMKLNTNSCHHQMMIPKGGEILAVSPNLSPKKFREDPDPIEDDSPEPEIVIWRDIKALGVQGHPEWVSKTADLYKLSSQLLKEELNVHVRG